MNINNQLKNYGTRGFTLIELLISISIIALLTGVAVFNQSDFSDQLALTNLTSEIDLQIREAQTYGVSVREFSPGTNNFNIAYGVSFNLGNPGSSNTSFFSFADLLPQNGYFDTPTSCEPGPSSECLSRYNLTRGNTLTDMCVIEAGGGTVCKAGVGRIDIVFVRPNPTAKIALFNNSGSVVNTTYPGFKGVKFEFTSPQGKKQYIIVYTSGQVSIQ
jgi:prepilin-type N-terminal cleavage/methylation domain-containing protein